MNASKYSCHCGYSGDLVKEFTCSNSTIARPAQIQRYCQLDETRNSWIRRKLRLRLAMNQMNLPACTYHRVLRLVRTIADLAWEEKIAPTHLAEARQYQSKLGMI